ncbi:uncharacterized protein LOC129916326 [Episyrphus balteatus]|uniref:uncharacterized protein LOC129916326 n=1 Tax=Episyrphus balteatus TaxID=286459 RepID=UPI00248571D5|nr:uncharacterized protein LOC129916326 [Episyrphus balteatus]
MVIPYKTLIFVLAVLHFIAAEQVNLTDTQARRKRGNNAGNNLVKEFLKSNLIHNNVRSNTLPIQYCQRGSRRTKRQLPQGHDMFDRIVQELRAAAINQPNQPYCSNRDMRPYNDVYFPFEEIIERKDIDRVKQPLYVTKYMKATIKSSHAGRRRIAIPKHIQDYLDLVGFIHGRGNRDPNADQVGHLLAYSLGGTNDDTFNFAPQTTRLNTQAEGSYSIWWGEERVMSEFLKAKPNRKINWELLVLHPPLTATGDLRLRPIGFCMRHINYNEHGVMVDNYNKPIRQRDSVLCFSNDAQDECRYETL